MPTVSALRLRITNTVNNTVVERTFTQLPVRIGRNTLNDLNIVDRFVSQFHAVVELHGDVLMLRDLGSSNGTRVGSATGARAPAHVPTELGPHKNVFAIGPLILEGKVVEVSAEEAVAPTPSDLPPLGPDEDAVLEDSFITNINQTLAFDDPAFAEARAKLAGALADESPKSVGSKKKSLTGTLVMDGETAAKQRAAVQAKLAATRSQPPLDPQAKERRLEQLALQGVREMARALLPHAPVLQEPDDLVRFLSKVRDTIEVFLRCFIPLRDGYRQFASQMHIHRGGGAASAIEAAQTERELAQHLLDWNNRGPEAHRAVEGTFADLMIHQLALLHALMRGVKSLLDTLSPKAVDDAFEELAKQGKTNFSWGPWRFKELWRLYNAKYGDVDDGDKRMFAALFGPDFAESYKQYRATVDSPES